MKSGTKEEYVPLETGEDTVNNKTEQKEQLKIEEVINRIMEGSLLKFVAWYLLGTTIRITVPMMLYLPIFAGHIPYNEWACLSSPCFSLLATHEENSTFYTRDTMCDNHFQDGVDFTWTSNRTSFALDWGLFCNKEGKIATIKSFVFIGGFLGLLSATAMYDRVGRKITTIVGAVIAAAATLGGALTKSVEVMLAVRLAQGFGAFVVVNGLYVWQLEFTPMKKRTFVNFLCGGLCWFLGTTMLVVVSYFVHDWRYVFVAVSIITVATSIPLLFYPESPRFRLVKGNETEAKKILKKLSQIFDNPISFGDIELLYTEHKQNYLDQLHDFLRYPTMLKTTLSLMLSWFVAGTLFYGLQFGWHKIGKDIYTSMLFSAVGGAFGDVASYGTNALIGRKKAMIMFFGGATLSFLVAIPDVELSGGWQLQNVACLFAVVFIIGAFGTIYLLTSELSPTSHRGMVLSFCSSSARVGAFLGPYISLLYDVWDRRLVLGVFAVAALCACGDMMLVGDSTGRHIPDTPAELKKKGTSTED